MSNGSSYIRISMVLGFGALTLVSSAAAADQMNLLAPSYYGNSGDDQSRWSSLEANWPTNGNFGLIVINPHDGYAADGTLSSNKDTMRYQDGFQPNYLGYVDLPESYDQNNNPTYGFDVSAKNTEIDNWFNYYDPLQGIFFDDVAREGSGSTSFDLDRIEAVVTHLMVLRQNVGWCCQPTTVVMNAAGNNATTAGLYHCVGNIVSAYGGRFIVVTVETYEDKTRSGSQNDINTHGGDFWGRPDSQLGWVWDYPQTTFAGLIHDGTAAGVLSDLNNLDSYNIGYVFITDQLESTDPNNNAWNPGPSADVWSQLAQNTGSSTNWWFNPGSGADPLAQITCPPPAPL